MAERTLPPLRLLSVFESVLRNGNVQAAARDLNVSQPAVSQSIRALEEYLGIILLDRQTRPARPTEAGRMLEEGIRDGFGRIADAIYQIRSLQTASERSITIACSVGTATYWLMPRLPQFYARHPEIAVNVMTSVASPSFVPDVDLLIRYGMGDWRDGSSIKLFGERVVPVCTPELKDQISVTGGLRAAVLLHVRSDDPSWLTWPEFLSRSGLPENRGAGRHFTNYVQATQAALSGQGVMLGWRSNTSDLVREQRLVPLDLSPLDLEEAFYLVVPHSRRAREPMRHFIEWVEGIAADNDFGTELSQ